MSLTDHKDSSHLAWKTFLESKRCDVLIWSLYLCALVSPLIWAQSVYPVATELSVAENALLPGLVANQFSEEATIIRFVEEFRSVHYDNQLLLKLGKRLRKFGIFDVFDFGNDTLYAFIRAPRSDATEALLLNVPINLMHWRNSLSIALALAKHFARQNYWAKDIILLFTMDGHRSLDDWLDSYSTSPHHSGRQVDNDLSSSALHNRPAIQVAIILQCDDNVDSVNRINVNYLGLDGRTPDSDLVALVQRLSSHNYFQTTIHYLKPSTRSGNWQSYKATLRNVVSSMLVHSAGLATGNHGIFLSFGIESLTIHASGPPASRTSSNMDADSLISIALLTESVLRSLNNLLERLHAGIFFYFAISANRILPISVYIVSVVVGLILPVLVSAVKIFYRLTQPVASGINSLPKLISLSPILIMISSIHAAPAVILHLAGINQISLDLKNMILITTFTVILFRYMFSDLISLYWLELKFCILVELGLALYAVSLVNFCLAFLSGLLLVPFLLSISRDMFRNGDGRLPNYWECSLSRIAVRSANTFFTTTTHPVSLILIYHVLSHIFSPQPTWEHFPDIMTLVERSVCAWPDGDRIVFSPILNRVYFTHIVSPIWVIATLLILSES